MSEMPETVELTREQAVRLMALSEMIRADELRFMFGEHVAAATEVLADISQECALQLGGLGND